ncbi:MAG: TIM barrel protein [Armatimonadetes bacterium]|jgi:sugar phosphate isomerase/epimerase|nr:TIM barrel protein [Armatimonadota bacterium]HPO73365.1 TIM barrel protein [Armatimonadota bacterium]
MESIYRYADVGLIHFMAYPQCIKGEGPILETLREIAEDPFFTAVEVTRMEDPQVRKEAAKLIKEAGMKAAFGGQPCMLTQKLSLCTLDDAARKACITELKRCMDMAYELGCVGFGVLSGPVPDDPSKYGEATDRLVDSLLELCAYSAQCGTMPVVLETFDRVPFGKNALIGPTKEAVEVSKRVRKEFPSFGLMLDLSHAPLLGETSADMLGTAGDHMVHAHIGNCVMRDSSHPAYGDEHPRFGVEGGENGVAELADFMQELLRCGYLKAGEPRIVSFEVKPIAAWGETSQVVVANAKRALQKAWAQVQL